MEQIVSDVGIGYVRMFGNALGNVNANALQAFDWDTTGAGGMGSALAGSTGTTYYAFELPGIPPVSPGTNLPTTTVVVGQTFSGVDPWGAAYGPTIPAFSCVGETQNAGFGWIPGYIP
ncbi:hypothetical protein ES703_93597 [subsurface metagenome]